MIQNERRHEFEQVAMAHTESLLRVARRLTPASHADEDVVQETLLSAWRSFHQFEAGTNCRSWLFKIMLNILNKDRVKPTLRIVELPENETLENVIPIRPSFADLANSDVFRAIGMLPDDQQVVLMLAAVEGFTCKEMSAILDIPIGTVMSRLSRARSEMRKNLGFRKLTTNKPVRYASGDE